MAKLVVMEKQDLEEMINKLLIEKENLSKQNFLKSKIEIIGIKEASDLTSLSERTIRWKVSRGEMPFKKRGKPLMFSKSDLFKWIEDGKPKVVQEADFAPFKIKTHTYKS
ncbi:MAG: helix-turn-helix domain-containing protein [Chitinophagaceae bacterium]|nr:helix-turn-helix domain-containing protein [Chitinophagaceae bacterium]